MTRTNRGYSLPMVMVLCILIAASAMVAMMVMQVSVQTTDFALGRREAFYTCEGAAHALAVASRPYLRSTTAPTTNDLMLAVCGNATPPCANGATYVDDAAYTIDRMELQVAGVPTIAPIPNGPFRMMNARQNPIAVLVELTKPSSKDRCAVVQRMELAEIGLFQFFVFSDGYMDLFPFPPMSIDGRVHINGEFCAHAYGANIPVITQLTASGRVLASCTRSDDGAVGTSFRVRDSTGTPQSIDGGCDSGCVTCSASCPGDVGTWRSFALSRWDGNLQDQEHGVPELRLPVPAFPPAQDGLDCSNGAVDNSESLRLLIDPPQNGEIAEISQQRYAWKADLRIIDGVWYKNDGTWPGVPIWSDHPGSYAPVGGSDEAVVLHGSPNVGQNDIAGLCADGPRRFSYYAHNCASPGALRAMPANPPVVSYGVVNNATPRAPASDGAGSTAASLAGLLAGTRTGFQDFRMRFGVATDPVSPDAERYRILPLNFDLAAFQAALADGAAGELGDHFPDGADADAAPDFNGIVYIHLSWPGSTTQKTTTATGDAGPPLPPRVHDVGGATGEFNGTDPQPLCSDTAAFLNGAAATACAGAAWPNAVRLINAATLSKAVLPRGLSIVTNAPAYLLGDTNAGSVTFTGGSPTHVPNAANWVPFMVGADATTFLSNSWRDSRARWNGTATAADLNGRDTTDTTYALSVIAGNAETSAAAWGGGINNFPRFLEDWTSPMGETVIYGSLVIGFRSVFQRQRWRDNDVYFAPTRTWLFDTNLSIPANQPPGAPSFFIQAVDDFRRD